MIISLLAYITGTQQKFCEMSEFPGPVQGFLQKYYHTDIVHGKLYVAAYRNIASTGLEYQRKALPDEDYQEQMRDILSIEDRRKAAQAENPDDDVWEVAYLDKCIVRHEFVIVKKAKTKEQPTKAVTMEKRAEKHAKKRVREYNHFMVRASRNGLMQKAVIYRRFKSSWTKMAQALIDAGTLCDYEIISRDEKQHVDVCGINHEIKTFMFRNYLADSELLMHELIDVIMTPGSSILLTAPCGAGKTYVMTKIQKILTGMKQVFLCVPLAMQTSQLEQDESTQYMMYGKKRKIRSVNGDGGGLDVTCEEMEAIVYDRIGELLSMSDEELSKVALIIDEAHNLYTQENFRGKAVSDVKEAAKRVKAAGGSVVYVTATPTKIMGFDFDDIFNCVKVGNDGMPVDQHCYDELQIILKDNRNSLRDALIQYIKKWIDEGYLPFIRLNNKKLNESIANVLRMSGLKVYTLSSDDKGYTITDGKRVYDSEAYADLIGSKSALPYCDVLLTTSVIECGTNVKGVWAKNADKTKDNPLQNRKLLPVFFVQNQKDFDEDNMQQFLSRVRYGVEKAIVFMNYSRAENGKSAVFVPLQKFIETRYVIASAQAESMTRAGSTFLGAVESLGKQKFESSIVCTMTDNGPVYSVDKSVFIAENERAFETSGYYNPEKIGQWMTRFGKHVSIKVVKKVKRVEHALPVEIKEDFKKLFQSMAYNPAFDSAVLSGPKIDMTDKTVQKLKKLGGSCAVGMMKRVRETAAFHGAPIKTAINEAIARVEDPDSTYRDPNTGKNLRTMAMDNRLKFLAKSGELKTSYACMQFLYSAASQIRGISRKLPLIENLPADPVLSGFSDDFKQTFAACLGDPRMKDFVLFWGYTGTAGIAPAEFTKTLKSFSEHDEEACHTMAVSSLYRMFNLISDDEKDRYRKNVMQQCSIAGSEYNAIRHPYHIVVFRKTSDGEIVKNNKGICYDHPFVGEGGKVIKHKTIDMELCGEIAAAFSKSMRNAGGCGSKRTYTAEYIMTLFTLIYASERSKTDNRGKVIKYQLGGLRKTKQHAESKARCQADAICRILDSAATDCMTSSEAEFAAELAVQTLEAEFDTTKEYHGTEIGPSVRQIIRFKVPARAKTRKFNQEIRDKIDAGCNDRIVTVKESSVRVIDHTDDGFQPFLSSVEIIPGDEKSSLSFDGNPFSSIVDDRIYFDDPRISGLLSGTEDAATLFRKVFPILQKEHDSWKSLHLENLNTDSLSVGDKIWTNGKKLKEMEIPSVRDFAEAILPYLLTDVKDTERKMVKDTVLQHAADLDKEKTEPAAA